MDPPVALFADWLLRPLGGPRMSPRCLDAASDKGGQTGNLIQKCGADLAGSARGFLFVGDYAAAFFVDFDTDLGAGFLLPLAFSLAANSCLTFAAMASVSTL